MYLTFGAKLSAKQKDRQKDRQCANRWARQRTRRYLSQNLLLICLLFSNAAYGAQWIITPSISLRDSYDNNRALTANTHRSVTAVALNPAIEMKRKTPLTQSNFRARYQTTKYSKDEIRDTNFQTYQFKFNRQGEKNNIKLNSKIKVDTTLATLNDQAQANNDVFEDDIEIDTGLTDVRIRRTKIKIEPAWKYNLSKKYVIELKYFYSSLDYENNSDPSLNETQRNKVSAGLLKRLSEIDTVKINVTQSKFKPDNRADSDDTSLLVGYTRKLSNNTSTSFLGGANQRDVKGNTTTGFVTNISLKRTYEISSFSASLSRNIKGGGDGRLTQADEFKFKYNRKITPLSQIFVNIKAFETENVDTTNNSANRKHVSIVPRVVWNLSKNSRLGFSYRYRKQTFTVTNVSASSRAAFLNIAYSFSPLTY